MKKILVFIFCFTTFRLCAQVYCEIDSVFKNYSQEIGYKVIQTADGNFVILSSKDPGLMSSGNPNFKLTKLDICGNIIWRSKTYDSCASGCFPLISDLHEEPDGCIMFSGCFSGSVGKDLRLYKTNATGDLLWATQIGDSAVQYGSMKSIKISSNKYLFAGSIVKPGPISRVAIAIIADTTGNMLFKDTFTTKVGGFGHIATAHNGNILLLGGEDTSFLLVTIDTLGNRISKKHLSSNLTKNNYYKDEIVPNFSATELFYTATSTYGDSFYVARFDLLGNILKDTIYTNYVPQYKSRYGLYINSLKTNHYLITGSSLAIIDPDLNIVWKNNDPSYNQINCSIIANDSIIVSTGSGNFRSIGIGNTFSDLWFGVTKAKALPTFTVISKIPMASFGFSTNLTIPASEIYLTDSSLNNPTKWKWVITQPNVVFQSGTSDTSRNPVIKFTQPGVYSIKLVVTSVFGADSITKQNVITVLNSAIPVANFVANKTYALNGTPVQLFNTSMFAQQVKQWYISPTVGYTYLSGDSTSDNPILRFDSAGMYSVALAVSNNWGADSIMKTDYLNISNERVSAYFKVSKTNATTFDTLILTDSCINATNRTWKITPNTYTRLSDSTLIFNKDGLYTLQLIASNAFDADTFTRTNYINIYTPLPQPLFYADKTGGYVGDTITLIDTSLYAQSRQWQITQPRISSRPISYFLPTTP